MDDTLHVAIRDSCQHLIKEFLDFDRFHSSSTETVHIGSEIFVQVLKNEIELLLVNNNIFESGSRKQYVTTFLWSIYRRSEI